MDSYYDKGGVSVKDIWTGKLTHEELCGLYKGNVIKYICRAGIKNPTQEIDDLKKAKQYLEWLIEEKEKKQCK